MLLYLLQFTVVLKYAVFLHIASDPLYDVYGKYPGEDLMIANLSRSATLFRSCHTLQYEAEFATCFNRWSGLTGSTIHQLIL